MRPSVLLALALFGALPAWAGAATIIGKSHGEKLQGTQRSDLIDVVGGGRDSVRCGKGIDTVVGDQSDLVARDCEVVARRIAVDTSQGAGAHATIVEPDAASDGATVVSVFQQGRQADGASAIGFATSLDGGTKWRSGTLPALSAASTPAGPWAVVSDPVVAYDAQHGRWIAAALALTATEEAIVASTSSDGLAWDAPVRVVDDTRSGADDVPLDKGWIDCDNGASSALRGHCYVVATVDPDTSRAHLVVWASVDGGVTWTTGGSVPAGYFVQTAVLADGTLVLFYLDVGRRAYATVSSVDGGATFSAPAAVAPATASLGQKALRAPSLPSLTQSRAGELLAVWTSCADSACAETGVLLTRSNDGGTTWTVPARLSLGPGLHVAPSIAADAVTGRVALNDYVTTSPTCCALVAQVATSADDGTTWTVRRASVRPFQASWLAPARGGAFLGDYVATTFAKGKAVSIMPFAEPPLAGRLREDLYAVRF